MDPITKRVITKKYYEYMVDMAEKFGANRTRAQIELMESLDFEVKMSTVSTVLFIEYFKLKKLKFSSF